MRRKPGPEPLERLPRHLFDRMDMKDSAKQRFWSRVQRAGDNECWLWKGDLRGGYGQFEHNNHGHRWYVSAHRAAYTLLKGEIPAGLSLDHLCRVRSCVNPLHLEPVTTRENILRGTGLAAAERVRTHCPRGHRYVEENIYRQRPNFRSCVSCMLGRRKVIGLDGTMLGWMYPLWDYKKSRTNRPRQVSP